MVDNSDLKVMRMAEPNLKLYDHELLVHGVSLRACNL